MAEETVRVKGLRELQGAFRKIDKERSAELRLALRAAAEPVRQEAQALFQAVDPASAAGYKVRVRARGVAVEQSKKRTTGLHPEFGTLQLERALIPALEAKAGEIVHGLDEALDRLGRDAGF